MKKRAFGVVAGTAFAVAAIGAPAASFEPPGNEPDGLFSCPGGDPVAGHPGAKGLRHAMKVSGNSGAWRAALNPDTPVIVCEPA